MKKFATTHLWVLLIVMLLGTDPTPHQIISDGVGKREVVVSRCRHISIFHNRVMQMAIKSLLEFDNIFHRSNTTNADLLSLLVVSLWFISGHGPMHEIYFFGCLLPSRPFVLGLPIALKVVVKYKASRKEQSG